MKCSLSGEKRILVDTYDCFDPNFAIMLYLLSQIYGISARSRNVWDELSILYYYSPALVYNIQEKHARIIQEFCNIYLAFGAVAAGVYCITVYNT